MGDDDSVGIHQGVTRWSKHWAILHWSAPGFQLTCCVAKPPKPARVSSVIAFAADQCGQIFTYHVRFRISHNSKTNCGEKAASVSMFLRNALNDQRCGLSWPRPACLRRPTAEVNGPGPCGCVPDGASYAAMRGLQ